MNTNTVPLIQYYMEEQPMLRVTQDTDLESSKEDTEITLPLGPRFSLAFSNSRILE